MTDAGVFGFCAAMGFVTAATVAHFYQWVTSAPADFSVESKSVPGLVMMVVVAMFGGPYIVMGKVIAGLRSKSLQALPAVMATTLACMWSVCAGVFFLSLMVAA